MQQKKTNPFDSPKLHGKMLFDSIRTSAYLAAIQESLRPEESVLDLGCGSGLLSFFAAQNGCREITAIDNSSVIDLARRIAERNGLSHIRFIKKDIARFRPKKKFDWIIHDQIGSYLWDEGIVPKINIARRRCLKKGGSVLPFKIDFYLAPTSYRTKLEKKLAKWDRPIHAIDFSPLKKQALLESADQALLPQTIRLRGDGTFLCDEKKVYSLDLRREASIPNKISTSFKIPGGSRVTGICGFFDIHLNARRKISTRPRAKNTHWGQIFIPLFAPRTAAVPSRLNFTLLPAEKADCWKYCLEFQPPHASQSHDPRQTGHA